MGAALIRGWITTAAAVCLVVQTTAADVVVPEADIHGVAVDYVDGLLSEFPGRAEVTARWRRDLTVKGTGAVSLQVRPDSRRSNARCIPVILEVCRGPVVLRELFVTTDVRYFDQVAVAAQPIDRGEALSHESVSMEEREVTTMLGRYVRDRAELAGKRAKMRIAFGRPIDIRYLERIPVVNRGDQVHIRVQIGTVTVAALGLSTESGSVGDRIVVQNVDSREKLVAEVVAPGVVQVAF